MEEMGLSQPAPHVPAAEQALAEQVEGNMGAVRKAEQVAINMGAVRKVKARKKCCCSPREV